MIGLGFYNVTQTTTDLNGPFLRFTSEPNSSTVNDGGSVTLTGIATAEFKHNPTIPGERVTNTGDIGFQWYIDGAAAEDTTDKISGSQTNELTLSNLDSATDNGKSVFLRAVYNGSAYQSEGGDITAGIAASTGNGVNEPVDTTAVVITVNSTISINTQPEDATAGQGIDATFTVEASVTDGSDLTYQWSQDGSPLSDGDTVSGANTPTLTISSTTLGDSTITVSVSHPTASNSPLESDSATFTVVAPRSIIEYYQHNESGDFFGSGSNNLDDGSFTLTADSSETSRLTSFHSPEKDIDVKITMAAGAGAGRGSNNGGQGGQSVFTITLEKDQEYVLKLGSVDRPNGGLNGGGGAAFLYKKARLLVALGGGGGAGLNENGGSGGGIGIGGEDGGGRNGGSGGSVISEGSLETTGVFPGGQIYGAVDWTSKTSGRVSGCTIGSEFFFNNYSPCDDIGESRFLDINGVAITQTPIIERGFKSGLAHRSNGGNGSGNEGGGGSGANGGNAGDSSGSGGGGASGYSSGDVTVVSTQLGGNTNTNAFCTFEIIES